LFVQADHLGRPVLMTAADGTVVWWAAYDAFGAVREIAGPASLDLRFPGQWCQLETGFQDNWHRHYDPSTGRYTTPDPLGPNQEPEPGGRDANRGSVAGARPEVLAGPYLPGPGRPVGALGDGLRVSATGRTSTAYAGSNPLQQTDLKGLWFGLRLVLSSGQSDNCPGPLLQPAAKKEVTRCSMCLLWRTSRRPPRTLLQRLLR
jgi:RHS repeat-associated protein